MSFIDILEIFVEAARDESARAADIQLRWMHWQSDPGAGARSAAWKASHRDRQRAYQRKWREANREKAAEMVRASRAKRARRVV